MNHIIFPVCNLQTRGSKNDLFRKHTRNCLEAKRRLTGRLVQCNLKSRKNERRKNRHRPLSDIVRLASRAFAGNDLIDMNIRKRVVTLTMYNEAQRLCFRKRSKPLQAALFKGLETLNYHLSSVKFKPLKDDAVKPKTKEAKTIVNLYHCEGIDFRI